MLEMDVFGIFVCPPWFILSPLENSVERHDLYPKLSLPFRRSFLRRFELRCTLHVAELAPEAERIFE